MGEQERKSNWWKWAAGAAAFGAAVFLGVKAFGGSNNTQTAGVSVTPTVLIAEASPTPEQMVTMTPEPSPTLIPTETPTATPTEAATPTPELTITDTPTPEPTEEPSPTPTEEVKPTDTITPTQIPTNMPTVMPTASPKPMATPTAKPTATPTVTPKPTNTPTEAPKPTVAPTSTPTPVPTNTPTPTPAAWAEPKERKDIADLLMAKVQAYRESNGVSKFKNPYVYYDVNAPGLGDRLNEKGLRVAKKCCMEHSANHEGFQIATGIYGYPWRVKEGWEAEDIAKQLFDAWYNSPAHNKNMLNDHFAQTQEVDVGVMHVVEYFDGEWWHYCAVMTISCVYYENLPEGLE